MTKTVRWSSQNCLGRELRTLEARGALIYYIKAEKQGIGCVLQGHLEDTAVPKTTKGVPTRSALLGTPAAGVLQRPMPAESEGATDLGSPVSVGMMG